MEQLMTRTDFRTNIDPRTHAATPEKAPVAQSGAIQPTDRQAYLDWLRILAIIGVLLFHSAMAYVAEWEWHLKNKETSNILMEFNFWLHNFRMPLLFFISGTVSYFMLKNRTAGGFIGLRFRRLFIPLVFGMLVVVPPQVYMERLTEGFKGNYWQFYPSIFTTGPYPKGNLSWHHLWFILYLLLYDILCAPLFSYLVSVKGRSRLARLNWLAKGQRIYLIMVISVILFISLIQHFPETNNLVQDALYFPYWMLFLLAGFFCVAWPPFMESLERNRRLSFAFAFLCIVGLDYLRWNGIEPWKVITTGWRTDWRTYAYFSLYPLTAWFWVLTAIGYGKKYLNRPHRVLNYLNEAVYPFYILHQTVIIIVVFYVTRTTDTIGMKYIFTVIVSFFLTMGIYHLFIRPFAVTRLLFGMKPKKKEGEGKPAREIAERQMEAAGKESGESLAAQPA